MIYSKNSFECEHKSFVCFSQYVQMIAEFDRVVQQQNASFLAMKLRWLELVPKILKAERCEGNGSIAHWLEQRSDSSDEGLFTKTIYTDMLVVFHDSITKLYNW